MDQFRPRDDQYRVRELQKGVEDIKGLLQRYFKGRGIWLVVVIAIIAYLLLGFYIVGAGEKGVVLFFGKAWSVTDPGLRYCLPPPFMKSIVVDVAKVRQAEVGFRPEGRRTRPIPAESLMLTGDENIVDVEFFVQYVVRDPIKFLFGAKDPEGALRVSAEVALRGVVGENTIDYTMTKGRREVQERVAAYLQRLLDAYNTGLQVTQASLLVVDPPAQVREAFHDVVRAWEDRERVIREAEGYREDIVPKARGEARREINQAEGYKAQRVIRAKGDVQRFSRILEEYKKAPRVTRERLYLESVERFLPGTNKFVMDAGNSRMLTLLPLVEGKPSAPAQISVPAGPAGAPSEKKGD
jgi:membrane protease subunit HflK